MITILLQKTLDLLNSYFTGIKTKLNTLYDNIGGGGGSEIVSLIDRTITGLSNNDVITIEKYAFAYCDDLLSISCPNCTDIKQAAFTYAGASAFEINNNFSQTSLHIGETAFFYSLIKKFICQSVNLTIDQMAFNQCRYMTDLNVENLEILNYRVFANNVSLVNVAPFKKAIEIKERAFEACSLLEELTFENKVTFSATYAFISSKLKTLTLKGSQMSTLSNINNFHSTAFWSTGTGGTIYVPSDMVTTYQNDPTWASLLAQNANNQILAIPTE